METTFREAFLNELEGCIIAWIGPISFEERCYGSLEELKNIKTNFERALLIEYPENRRQQSDGKRKKKHHKKKILGILDEFNCENVVLVSLPPYHFGPFKNAIKNFFDTSSTDEIIFLVDITCLTKVHTIAFASFLNGLSSTLKRKIFVAYSRPKEYGAPAIHSPNYGNWQEFLFSPCDFKPFIDSEKTDGVILLGHESVRINLSLKDISPEEAIVVLAKTPGKEFMQVVTRTENARLLSKAEMVTDGKWRIKEVDHFDIGKIQEIVFSFTELSTSKRRRLVLYPFGPKPLILGAAFAALSVQDANIWFSYPIPRFYDIAYTRGWRKVEWFCTTDFS